MIVQTIKTVSLPCHPEYNSTSIQINGTLYTVSDLDQLRIKMSNFCHHFDKADIQIPVNLTRAVIGKEYFILALTNFQVAKGKEGRKMFVQS